MRAPTTSPKHAFASRNGAPPLAAGPSQAEALTARAHYARMAELSAYRYAHALAGRRYSAAARAEREYKRASRRCRELGEQLRLDGLEAARRRAA